MHRAASSSRKALVLGRTGSPLPSVGCPPSLTCFPESPMHRKAAFRPSAAGLAYITRLGGGWRRSWEPESYPRRVSHVCPGTLPRLSPARPGLVHADGLITGGGEGRGEMRAGAQKRAGSFARAR